MSIFGKFFKPSTTASNNTEKIKEPILVKDYSSQKILFTNGCTAKSFEKSISHLSSNFRLEYFISFFEKHNISFPIKVSFHEIHMTNFFLECKNEASPFKLQIDCDCLRFTHTSNGFKIVETYDLQFNLKTRAVSKKNINNITGPNYYIYTCFSTDSLTITSSCTGEVVLDVFLKHSSDLSIVQNLYIVNENFENAIINSKSADITELYNLFVDLYNLTPNDLSKIESLLLKSKDCTLHYVFGNLTSQLYKLNFNDPSFDECGSLEIEYLSKSWTYKSKLFTLEFSNPTDKLVSDVSQNAYVLKVEHSPINLDRFNLFENYFNLIANKDWTKMTNFINNRVNIKRYKRSYYNSFSPIVFYLTAEQLRDFKLETFVTKIELAVEDFFKSKKEIEKESK